MTNETNECGKIAYAYVPIQTLDELYTPLEGLKRGTVFPELDLPIEVYGKNASLKEER